MGHLRYRLSCHHFFTLCVMLNYLCSKSWIIWGVKHGQGCIASDNSGNWIIWYSAVFLSVCMCANGHTSRLSQKCKKKKDTGSNNYVLNYIVGVIIGITPRSYIFRWRYSSHCVGLYLSFWFAHGFNFSCSLTFVQIRDDFHSDYSWKMTFAFKLVFVILLELCFFVEFDLGKSLDTVVTKVDCM